MKPLRCMYNFNKLHGQPLDGDGSETSVQQASICWRQSNKIHAACTCCRRHGRSAGQAENDMSKRPAWVNPGKCAAQPWRPLEWDHVSQAQLIAFEAGLRRTPPSPQAAQPDASEPCRVVAWETEQSAAGSQQTAPHQGQQQQQDFQPPGTCDATQDSHAAVRKHAWAPPQGTGQAATSGREASSTFDGHPSCSPSAHHSTQGNTMQHKTRQPIGAGQSSPCQHFRAQRPMQRPSRDCPRHDSAVNQPTVAGSCLQSRAQGTSGRVEIRKDNRTSPDKLCMAPSSGGAGTSGSPGQSRPGKAVGASKGQRQGAAGYRAHLASPHGNAECAAQAHGSSQQRNQSKPGLPAGPTHMKNWVQWESHQDKVKDHAKRVNSQLQLSVACLCAVPAQLMTMLNVSLHAESTMFQSVGIHSLLPASEG